MLPHLFCSYLFLTVVNMTVHGWRIVACYLSRDRSQRFRNLSDRSLGV